MTLMNIKYIYTIRISCWKFKQSLCQQRCLKTTIVNTVNSKVGADNGWQRVNNKILIPQIFAG